MTFLLGLTGSIGMGKSTTAAMFAELGVPIHDADKAVHALYRGRAAPLIEEAFPGTVRDGEVDRKALGAQVIGKPDAMRRLETIIHPLVRAEEIAFVTAAASRRAPLVILDVPLLFETGGERRCDAVAVVTADPELQRARVLARPNVTEESFAAILAKQMPDAEKRRRAHVLVDTGRGLADARAQVADIVRALAGRPGRAVARRAESEADRVRSA